MSITVTPIVRAFHYNGIQLADVPGLTPREVRDLYSAQYPELISAEIEAGDVSNGRQDFTFRKAVGTKGAGAHGPRVTALLSRVREDEGDILGESSKLARALSNRAVVRRSTAWSRFAQVTMAPARNDAAVSRVSATSDMLAPLP